MTDATILTETQVSSTTLDGSMSESSEITSGDHIETSTHDSNEDLIPKPETVPNDNDKSQESSVQLVKSSDYIQPSGHPPQKQLSTETTTSPSASQLALTELNKAKRDLESMVLKYAKSERENLQNQMKVEELDKKLKRTIKDNDQLANRIKLLTNDKNQLTDSLNAKVAQLTVLEQKNLLLNDKQGVKLKDCEEKVKKLEQVNEDLLKRIESYKNKEGELLDFTERLSMKHMILQSELDEALKKVPNYKNEYEALLLERNDLLKEKDKLNLEIEKLSESLRKEQSLCASLREEQELNEIRYRNQLDELQNEIKVMRRKHQISYKELIKEIKQLQVRLEKVEPVSNTQSSLMTA